MSRLAEIRGTTRHIAGVTYPPRADGKGPVKLHPMIRQTAEAIARDKELTVEAWGGTMFAVTFPNGKQIAFEGRTEGCEGWE